jgi:hypothetical protein
VLHLACDPLHSPRSTRRPNRALTSTRQDEEPEKMSSTLQGNTTEARGMVAIEEKLLDRHHGQERVAPLAEQGEEKVANGEHDHGLHVQRRHHEEKQSMKKDKKGKGKDDGSSEPEGGYDPMPLPPSEVETYIIKVTFHRATTLPPADLPSFSADPYIMAQMDTPSLAPRHREDPPLRYRGRTERNTREPKWEDEWIIGGFPKEGGTMKVVVMDEDFTSHDDRLGHLKVEIRDLGGPEWKDIKRQRFELKKRWAGRRVNLARAASNILNPLKLCRDKTYRHQRDEIEISVEVIGSLQPGEEWNVGRAFTLGPGRWWQHYSPLLGRIAGTKGGPGEEREGRGKEGQVAQYEYVDRSRHFIIARVADTGPPFV